MKNVLSKEELESIDGFFRASTYLSVAQLYLKNNPLLRHELKFSDIKSRQVGHFGSAPNQNLIYIHLNRIICKYNLKMFYISGPGHAGQSLISNNYLEGTYTEFYPKIEENIEGMKKLCKQFSYPYGVSSHAAPETPGSINEGGELGYSLVHAYGAVLDNPNLIVACCIGDGEAETATIATSWHLNKFMNRKKDGIVLPILNLNGYKIANPTFLSRIDNTGLISMFSGMGYDPCIIEGENLEYLHQKLAEEFDLVVEKIKKIKSDNDIPYKLPLVILKTPKGVFGQKIEGTFRSHQIPFIVSNDNKDSLELLKKWLISYKPNELFDKKGKLKSKYKLFVPKPSLRMGNSLYTNGGLLRKKLKFPSIYKYGIKANNQSAMDMLELGSYLKDVIKLNPTNFLILGPDEALSNRLNNVFLETNRKWNMKTLDTDEYLDSNGRIIDSFLSENVCEGLLEGYVLTGRHGIFHTYEAFSRIIDSMISQHIKWISASKKIKWRKSISSLNIILTSHIWQQDHNGYTHQEPGFLNHLASKNKNLIGMYLPMDANTLICTVDKCLKEKDKVNAIVASKHKRPIYLNMNEAKKLVEKGIDIFDSDSNPDIVLSFAGDTPALEVLASVKILKKFIPKLRVRIVSVINLLKLAKDYNDALTDKEFKSIFLDKPNLFVFHGYSSLIKELIYDWNTKMKIIGYKEEGAITTPFDMRVRNEIDRFHICLEVSKLLKNKYNTKSLKEYCNLMLKKHKSYIKKYGKDLDIIEY